MAARSCRRPVYQTMCESDSGQRKGGTRRVKYESRPKKGHTITPKGVSKTPTTKTARHTVTPKGIEFREAVRNLDDLFYKAYEDLYDGRVRESYDMMDAGDELIKSRPNLFKAFYDVHQDFVTSDREVMAYYLALKRSKHRKLLFSVDQKKRPATKRTVRR